MKKFYISCMAMLAAAPMMNAASGTNSVLERMKTATPRIAVMGQTAPTSLSVQLDNAGLRQSHILNQKPNFSQSASSWSALEGPNGADWMYTQKITEVDFYIRSSEITIFDEKHAEAGKISINIPEGTKVNRVIPYGPITKKMYDSDANTFEMPVNMHYIIKPGEFFDSTFIYNMQGEIVRKYECSNTIYYNYATSEWDNSSQRVLIDRSVLDEANEKAYRYVDVLAPLGWGDTEPKVKHTFIIDEALINYSEGPYLNVCIIDDEPYYVISHYEKPYMSGYDETTWEPIVNPDNSYILKVYDSNFEAVDSVKVPLTVPDGALYRFASFGIFSSDDMSKGYFDNTTDFKYVITFSDYQISTDSNLYTFDVYNGDNQKEKTIFANSSDTYFKLSDIDGQPEQYAFLHAVGDGTAIQTVDLPSCEKKTLIPAQIDGASISSTLDRYPKNDSYQYVISIAQGDVDADGNVISSIGWYNTDLTLDHFTKFNLGPNAEYFNPLITDQILNPYILDTDDDHDYLFIAKIKRDNSSVIDNVLFACHENGDTIATFKGNDTIGGLYTAAFLNYSTTPELFVSYRNVATDTYDMNYYALPFSKFALGGDGSKDNPYLISTVGDMKQIAAAPEASYKIANDIDMSAAGNWTPIESFSGNLNGDNHTLSGMTVDCDAYQAGLFGSVSAGRIENIKFNAPYITVNEDNSYVGVVAGVAQSDSICNIHVKDAMIIDPSGETWNTVGGLVGQATSFSQINDCSFNNGTIKAPGCDGVGAIVGVTRTSTAVNGCAVFGNTSISAGSSVGGIVGETGMGSTVADCHAVVDINGSSSLGGIVGDNSSRGLVNRCIAEGSLISSGAMWGGVKVGGIVGSLASDWEDMNQPAITNCVSAASITCPVTEADPEMGIEADATFHRIVGRTIANEYSYEGETPQVEKNIASNYALASVTINGNTVTSTDPASVEGASAEIATLNEEFFKTVLGYAFNGGTEVDSAAPWKATNALPILFIENENLSGVKDVITPIDNTIAVAQRAGSFVATGAVKMMVYSMNGQLVNSVNSDSIAADKLNAGIYIVVAIDADGRAHSTKAIVK